LLSLRRASPSAYSRNRSCPRVRACVYAARRRQGLRTQSAPGTVDTYVRVGTSRLPFRADITYHSRQPVARPGHVSGRAGVFVHFSGLRVDGCVVSCRFGKFVTTGDGRIGAADASLSRRARHAREREGRGRAGRMDGWVARSYPIICRPARQSDRRCGAATPIAPGPGTLRRPRARTRNRNAFPTARADQVAASDI
jgi:hypothetical protein